jgi:hypothetical protein
MPHFEVLGSLVQDLHQEFVKIYYLVLPVFFALALVAAWVRQPTGGPDFLDTLKRAIIATILLVALQDISQGIQFTDKKITVELHSWVNERKPSPTLLRPNWNSDKTERDTKWNLIINEEVEPDV